MALKLLMNVTVANANSFFFPQLAFRMKTSLNRAREGYFLNYASYNLKSEVQLCVAVCGMHKNQRDPGSSLSPATQ